MQTEKAKALLFQEFHFFPEPFLQIIRNRLIVGWLVTEQQRFFSTNGIETAFSARHAASGAVLGAFFYRVTTHPFFYAPILSDLL